MTTISQNYGKVILFSLLSIVPLLLISNSVLSFGQTNATNSTAAITSSNQTNTTTTTTTTDNPNSETIKSIDTGISMIKSGDNDGALTHAEEAKKGLA